jgi:hypothetical protein
MGYTFEEIEEICFYDEERSHMADENMEPIFTSYVPQESEPSNSPSENKVEFPIAVPSDSELEKMNEAQEIKPPISLFKKVKIYAKSVLKKRLLYL